MKLDILSREIADITVTDDMVAVSLVVSISHGQIKKSITPITVEHEVPLSVLLPGDETSGEGIDDAVVIAVAGAHKRADEAIKAIRGLDKL